MCQPASSGSSSCGKRSGNEPSEGRGAQRPGPDQQVERGMQHRGVGRGDERRLRHAADPVHRLGPGRRVVRVAAGLLPQQRRALPCGRRRRRPPRSSRSRPAGRPPPSPYRRRLPRARPWARSSRGRAAAGHRISDRRAGARQPWAGRVPCTCRRKAALSGVLRSRSSRTSRPDCASRPCSARRSPRTTVNSAGGSSSSSRRVPDGGDVDRREDPPLGQRAVQVQLHVAGALQLLVVEVVGPRAGVHQRGREDGQRAALLGQPRRAEQPLGPEQRGGVHAAGERTAAARAPPCCAPGTAGSASPAGSPRPGPAPPAAWPAPPPARRARCAPSRAGRRSRRAPRRARCGACR